MFTNIVCKTKQFYFLPAIFKNWNYAMTSPKPYFIGLKCNKNTIESTAIWHKHGMWNKKESFRNTNENVSYGINVYLQSLNNTYSPWVGEVSNNNYHTSKQTSSSWENCPLNYYSRCRSVYRPMPKQPTSRVSITKETIHDSVNLSIPPSNITTLYWPAFTPTPQSAVPVIPIIWLTRRSVSIPVYLYTRARI